MVIFTILITFLLYAFWLSITRRLANPIGIVVLYWGSFLVISQFSLTGLFIPSANVIFLHIFFLIAISIGGILALHFARGEGARKVSTGLSLLKLERLIRGVLLLCLPFVVYFFLKALPLHLSGAVENYRESITMMDNNPVLSSSKSYFLIYIFLHAIIFSYLFIAVAMFFLLKKKAPLILYIVFACLLSTILFNRIYIYWLIVAISLGFLFFGKVGIEKLKKHKSSRFSAILVAALSVTALLYVSSIRSGSAFDSLKRYVVDYHTVGFVLFDIELNDDSSTLLSDITYGLGMFGGIEQVVVLILRRIDSSIEPIVKRESLGEFKVAGYSDAGNPKQFNAMYNIVYTLYRDGKHIAILVWGVIIGFLLQYYYRKWLKNKCITDALLVIFFTHILFLSVFRGYFESIGTWFALLSFLAVAIKDRRVNKVAYDGSA